MVSSCNAFQWKVPTFSGITLKNFEKDKLRWGKNMDKLSMNNINRQYAARQAYYRGPVIGNHCVNWNLKLITTKLKENKKTDAYLFTKYKLPAKRGGLWQMQLCISYMAPASAIIHGTHWHFTWITSLTVPLNIYCTTSTQILSYTIMHS